MNIQKQFIKFLWIFDLQNSEIFIHFGWFGRVTAQAGAYWFVYPRKGPGTRDQGKNLELGYPPERIWDQRLGEKTWDWGTYPPPHVDRQTDACENITFPSSMYAGGNQKHTFSAYTYTTKNIMTKFIECREAQS